MLYNPINNKNRAVSESIKPYTGETLKESDIALRWLKWSKSLSGKLYTEDGNKVVVIEPGVINRDSGPDFKDAMILINGVVIRGDVEIHLDSRSWYTHSHHTNPSYNDVILHVVVFDSGKSVTMSSEGTIIPTVKFPLSQDWEARIQNKLSWPLDEGCYHEMTRMNSGEVYMLLLRLGKDRFNKKKNEFKFQRETGLSYGDLFYRGFARALGYSKNSNQFSKFCKLLPLKKIKKITRNISEFQGKKLLLNSILFGLSGLRETGEEDKMRQKLAEKWKKYDKSELPHPMNGHEWNFFRLRPLNFPTRRMAALGEFLLRYDPDRFLHLASFAAKKSLIPEQFIKVIENFLILDGDSYWSKMARFGKNMPKETALLGKNKARSIVLNVVLPILSVLAEEEQDIVLTNRINRTLFVYPAEQDNSVLKHVRRFVLPSSPDNPMFSGSSLIQQGMLQLYNRWCSREQSLNCPLSSESRGAAFG